jgi:hypothetical protein
MAALFGKEQWFEGTKPSRGLILLKPTEGFGQLIEHHTN